MPTETTDTVCPDCGDLLPRWVAAAADELYGGYRKDVSRLAEQIADLIDDPGLTDAQIFAYAVERWIGHDPVDLVAAVRHYAK